MFGFATKVREKQLKRALLAQNAVMVCLFGYMSRQAASGVKGDVNGAIGSAINHLFAKQGAPRTFGPEERALYARVFQMAKADVDLEKLILRILFDVFSLSEQLKLTKLRAEYPDILTRLADGQGLYPELYKDWKEVQFKSLLEKFSDKYDPSFKPQIEPLFR